MNKMKNAQNIWTVFILFVAYALASWSQVGVPELWRGSWQILAFADTALCAGFLILFGRFLIGVFLYRPSMKKSQREHSSMCFPIFLTILVILFSIAVGMVYCLNLLFGVPLFSLLLLVLGCLVFYSAVLITHALTSKYTKNIGNK